MKFLALTANGFALLLSLAFLPYSSSDRAEPVGTRGGALVVSSHSEPRTLNPLTEVGTASRRITQLLNADLIHIDSATQQPEPALAESWSVLNGGRRYVLKLRHGVQFSDGAPFNADDVVFSFAAYLDPRVESPQRDLLVIAGKPIEVEKVDDYTVAFNLAQPYAAAERLFDGIAMLPRHLLEPSRNNGTLRSAWTLATPPNQLAGLGPFRLASYAPGRQLVLERNPHYWKIDSRGTRLPYLDRLSEVFAANTDAEVLRFEQGETDIIDNLDAQNFALLERHATSSVHAEDLGPGLEYEFLFLNQNRLEHAPSDDFIQKQSWFDQTAFRKAISFAIDREALVRVAYLSRATAIDIPVTPANKRWVDPAIPRPERSLNQARRLLASAHFSWSGDKTLVDSAGHRVRFSIAVNAAKPQHVAMATLIQQDLAEIGIHVDVDELDAHSLLDRVFHTFRYEAAMLALADGDADPNSEMNVLTSSGTAHLWQLSASQRQLSATQPVPGWQLEIDRLMNEQLISANYEERKSLYNLVQKLIWDNMPMICLASPHILVAAKTTVGNFHPAILGDHTLWNADRLFVRH